MLSHDHALPRLHDVSRVPVAADDPRMENTAREAHPEDFFDFIRLLGAGSYGKVGRYRGFKEKSAFAYLSLMMIIMMMMI